MDCKAKHFRSRSGYATNGLPDLRSVVNGVRTCKVPLVMYPTITREPGGSERMNSRVRLSSLPTSETKSSWIRIEIFNGASTRSFFLSLLLSVLSAALLRASVATGAATVRIVLQRLKALSGTTSFSSQFSLIFARSLRCKTSEKGWPQEALEGWIGLAAGLLA